MTKKHDKKPPQAAKQLHLGDRPPFVPKWMDNFLKVFLVFVGIACMRWFQYQRVSINPQMKSTLPTANYSTFNEDAWGTYRPQSYFGLRARKAKSPVFGMAWYSHRHDEFLSGLRHWCNQDDGVQYIWEAADGKSMGSQDIKDGRLNMSTQWFNRHNSWSAQIKVARNDSASTSIVFYFILQDPTHSMELMGESDVLHRLWVHQPNVSDFHLEIDVNSAKGFKRSQITVRNNPSFEVTNVEHVILRGLAMDKDAFTGFNTKLFPQENNPNFYAVHLDLPDNAVITIEYRDETEKELPDFETEFKERQKKFDQQVQKAFFDAQTSKEPLPADTVHVGKLALSNMLGGIGYWDGMAKMRSKYWSADRVEDYGPLELFSAVPSRPFFPRGFIWDEDVIEHVNCNAFQIVSSWLNTMNTEGWIPREMILGTEAEAKVPQEFVVQSDRVANPPVFFYLMDKFVHNPEFIAQHKQRILSMYPRLKQWYIWLRNTQQGPLRGTFQWQGRNGSINTELNPKTLPSGLDDYPRASHPSASEYHVDLRSWLAVASKVIRYLAELAQDGKFISEADEDQRFFNDFEALNKFHWSAEAGQYCDYGLHSKSVRLEKIIRPNQPPFTIRKVLQPPKEGLVDDVFGYVNLFPFFLKLVPAGSEQLATILKNLDDPKLLWSPYGLRSISTRSPYYNKHNTEHDPPYWRGNIWINANYMALSALRHYATTAGGETAERADELYSKLRNNIVSNIVRQHKKTGQFWEHYSDKNGNGGGTRPFTGWTALVLAIMTDQYD
ncbi:putative mannosyl-oligosaccharide glucosidase [Aphelenchoides bicaudatus]|nr:putative mannosyl-oligosaccharide glucosidase [Aphelenchoides bicaudatus]